MLIVPGLFPRSVLTTPGLTLSDPDPMEPRYIQSPCCTPSNSNRSRSTTAGEAAAETQPQKVALNTWLMDGDNIDTSGSRAHYQVHNTFVHFVELSTSPTWQEA